MIDIDPATASCQKSAFTPAYYLPSLCADVSIAWFAIRSAQSDSLGHWTLAVLGWCACSWYRASLNSFGLPVALLITFWPLCAWWDIQYTLKTLGCIGKALSSSPLLSSLGSHTLQSCVYEYIYVYKNFFFSSVKKIYSCVSIFQIEL